MKIDTATGLLDGARQQASPNYDSRPAGCEPELLVIHNISLPPGEFGGPEIDALFTNTLDPAAHPSFSEIAHIRVSAHILIRRDGELVQYVPFHKRAWHAGESSYSGRTNCNDFSIGIELEGADNIPYTDPQYRHLAELLGVLLDQYAMLQRRHIVGHADIAPQRKTDPGPSFSWQTLNRLLDERMV